MNKTIGMTLATLTAFAAFSGFAGLAAADVGIRINGQDLSDYETVEYVSDLDREGPAHAERFDHDGDGVENEETVWILDSAPSEASGITVIGSNYRQMEFKLSTDSGVQFDGPLGALVYDQDVRVVFDNFQTGADFWLYDPEFAGLGQICYVFGAGTVINPRSPIAANDGGYDILEPQLEFDGVTFEFEAGCRFSFDVSSYLPSTQYAVKLELDDGNLWEVRNVETRTEFNGAAIDGALPSKDSTEAAATPLAIKIDDEVSLNVKVKRSGETQPLVDADTGDSGIFYGTLEGYEDAQNVVVVKGRDGMVVTEVNDFKNDLVYKTITVNGRTTTVTTHLEGNRFEGSYPHERYLPAELEAQRLQADYVREGTVTGPVYVDLLVVFDKMAKKFAVQEDRSGITNFAQTAVGKMNLALLNSGLEDKFRFRLLGVMSIDDNVNGDLDAALDNVEFQKGKWKSVIAERDRLGADLVSILVDTGDAYGWTGLGYSLRGNPAKFKNYGFNACAVRSVAISDTMTHEVGHNMGAGHADAEHMEKEYGPQYEFCSSGYYFTAGGVKYHTIMAYDTDKNFNRYHSAPFFSTPAKTYQGTQVGDSSHDNVSTIAKTYLAISSFRAPAMASDPTDPTDPTAPTDPTDPPDQIPPVVPDADDMSVPVVLMEDIVSGYNVGKAVKLTGCTLDSANHPTGMLELKIGKANRKTGISKISGSYTPIGGKKVSLKAVEKKGVNIQNGNATAIFTLKGLDGLLLIIGANAAGQLVFAGRLGDSGVSSVNLTAPEGVKHFTIDSLPAELNGVVLNPDYLPTSANGGEAVDMTTAKWVCAKAMAVKFKKLKGATEPSWVENNGKPAGDKTNRSGLKLTYTAKKGTFKGSFTAYGLAKGKLKKLKFSVTGVVVEGKVFGVSTFKKVNYECAVK